MRCLPERDGQSTCPVTSYVIVFKRIYQYSGDGALALVLERIAECVLPIQILVYIGVLAGYKLAAAHVCGAEGIEVETVGAVSIERAVIHIEHDGGLDGIALPIGDAEFPLLVDIGLKQAAERFQLHL